LTEYFYRIERQTNPLGRDYYSLLKIPEEGGKVENLGDYESLREAKKEKKFLEKQEIKRQKKLLSLKEAGDVLGVHPQTVRNLINRGKLKSIKIANLRRVPREEIERLLREGTEEN